MSPAEEVENVSLDPSGLWLAEAQRSSSLSPRVLPLRCPNNNLLLTHVHPNGCPTKPKLPGIATHSSARVQGGILPSASQFSLEFSEGSSPSESCFPKILQCCSPALLAAGLWKKSWF